MTSIIIPIYNAEPYLRRCIDSVLAQTVKDFEIILIDDGSTDRSITIANTYAKADTRIVLLQQNHAGQSAARNNGLRHAQGDFIAFVDADDWIEPDWLETHLNAIHDVDYVQSGNPRHPYQFTVAWQRLYRKQAIINLPFPEGMIYEDILWSVDLWLSGASCRCIAYNGYHYTLNPAGTTATARTDQREQVFVELRKRLHTADRKGKRIVLYTLIRLKLYFLCS